MVLLNLSQKPSWIPVEQFCFFERIVEARFLAIQVSRGRCGQEHFKFFWANHGMHAEEKRPYDWCLWISVCRSHLLNSGFPGKLRLSSSMTGRRKKPRNSVTLRAEDARSEDDTDWLPEQLGQPLERLERASKRLGRCHYDCWIVLCGGHVLWTICRSWMLKPRESDKLVSFEIFQ